jgi:hypothetical protein
MGSIVSFKLHLPTADIIKSFQIELKNTQNKFTKPKGGDQLRNQVIDAREIFKLY